MKKYLILSFSIIAVMLFFTACSDEDDTIGKGKEGFITFLLSDKAETKTTYADPIATNEENALVKLHVYMFDDTGGTLEKVFRVDAGNIKGSGTARTVTLDVTGRTGKKRFYFIGNGDGRISNLDNVNVGETKETDFVETLSDRTRTFIKTPLLMSGRTEIANIETPANDEKKVILKRRVARFDVDNDSTVTNFVVERIVVGKANQRSYLFSQATGIPAQTIEIYDLPSIDFSKFTNANKGETKSVFYLDPTILGTGKTDISFEGKLDGNPQVYNLKLTNDVKIEANTRYILKAKKVPINKIQFEIAIANWENGEEHEAEPSEDNMSVSDALYIEGDGILTDNVLNVSNATKTSAFRFTVKTYSTSGVRIETLYERGAEENLPGMVIEQTGPVLTYGAYYTQHFTVKVPMQPIKIPVNLKITAVNTYNPEQRKEFRVYNGTFQNTQEFAILFDGTYWAPLNTGATNPKGTGTAVSDVGYYYQWGREQNVSTCNQTGNNRAGPVNWSQGTASYTGNFIAMTNTRNPNNGNWLTPHNAGLWQNGATGPCPVGWRVPTEAEWQKIVNAFNRKDGTVSWKNPHLEIKGTYEGDTLRIPHTRGHRGYNNGTWQNVGYCYYWTCTPTSNDYTRYFYFNGSNGDVYAINSTPRAQAMPVRCVVNTP